MDTPTLKNYSVVLGNHKADKVIYIIRAKNTNHAIALANENIHLINGAVCRRVVADVWELPSHGIIRAMEFNHGE